MTVDNSRDSQWKIQVKFLTPGVVSDLAYALYVATVSPHSAIGKVALKFKQDFDEMVAVIPIGTPESRFLMIIGPAIISLARSIERNKRNYNANLRTIAQVTKRRIHTLGRAERWSAIFKVGFRLLILGGCIYALVQTIFSVPSIAQKTTGVETRSAAWASALGVMFLWYGLRSYISELKVYKILDEHTRSILAADYYYAEMIRVEYELTEKKVIFAWESELGEPPPRSPNFKEVLDAMEQEKKMKKMNPQQIGVRSLMKAASQQVMEYLQSRIKKPST